LRQEILVIDPRKLSKSDRLNAEMLLTSGGITSWPDLRPDDHVAHFYETESFLLNSLTRFVMSGFSNGESVIVVVTPHHREGLERSLFNNGVNLVEAFVADRYIPMDAATVLETFMVNGMPDRALFRKTLSPFIARLLDGEPVRAFGEMVALLWKSGRCDAAIELERLWDEIEQEHPFTLYCAYPLDGFGEKTFSQPLLDICDIHSRVIPAESYTALSTQESRLRAILGLQQKARALEAEIAERRRAEEELEVITEELERQVKLEQAARADAEYANQMKDEFLTTISHELRTPLNAIIGWVHMLQTGSLDEQTCARALETIDRNARTQAQVVEDILDVARIITGKLRLNAGSVNIAAVMNAAIDSVRLTAESKGIQLHVTVPASPPHIQGDAVRLQQVVWNLLSNAIKFTSSGGKVEVELFQDDASIHIKVKDSGAGIDQEFLPFIFDRFRQADGTITRRHGGLGVGLAIVRHLVELHGGIVRAESPGLQQGSTFIVSLPASSQSEDSCQDSAL
jgi:signal transduction histidine kinase